MIARVYSGRIQRPLEPKLARRRKLRYIPGPEPPLSLTPATETDKATILSVFMPARETDAAVALDTDKVLSLSVATESGAAQALNIDKAPTLTPATESDAAQAIDKDKYVRPAFASTPVLDNFNRADEGPPMTGWAQHEESGLKVLTNQLAGNDTFGGAYWQQAMVGRDVEAYVSIATVQEDGRTLSIFARLEPNATGIGDGYAVSWTPQAGDDGLLISRHITDLAVYTLFSTTLTTTPSDIGIRCLGDRIEAWAKLSGTWQFIGSVVDDNPFDPPLSGDAPADKLGLTVPGTVCRLDNFGGGAVGLAALETDAAQVLDKDKSKTLTATTETDVVVALDFTSGGPQQKTLTPATETDKAIRLSVFRAALETDAAVALDKDKVKVLTPTTSTNAAQALDKDKQKVLVNAVETDSARPLVFTKTIFKALVACTETDSARPLSMEAPLTMVIVAALETDRAWALQYKHCKVFAFSAAPEGDLTLTAAPEDSLGWSQASEEELAFTGKDC